MLIMINGAFGVGKSTTAELLQANLANSMIYDPEQLGFVLKRFPLIKQPDDFQHFKMWPILTVKIAKYLRKYYRPILIVPMTFAFPAYFKYVKAGFAAFGPALYHFCLTASSETIHARLEARGETTGGWAYQQTERCLAAFRSNEYEKFVDTEKREPSEIVEYILKRIKSSA